MLKTSHQTQKNTAHAFRLFKAGDEAGLNHFYRMHYPYYAYCAERFVKDDLVADTITQEAFLRLWLMREAIRDTDHLHEFIRKQLNQAGTAYYSNTAGRFHRSMLRLDGIEDYQEFMCGYTFEDDDDTDTVYLEQLEHEKRLRLEKINQLLPNISQQQQLFIRLCLKYDFNYERIAHHVGGISDYEVGLRVERCIASLKSLLSDSQRLDTVTRKKPLVSEGALTDEQAQVLNLRYELQYSFEEIATTLQLDDTKVKQLFIQAHAAIRKNKKSA